MTVFATETFDGVEDTELSAHNAAWSKAFGVTQNCQIANNRLRGTVAAATGSHGYVHSGTPASADYSVSADIVMVSAVGNEVGVIGRCAADASTMYHARHTGSTGTIQLFKFVAGTSTQLGTGITHALTAGTSVNLRLEMIGSTISVYRDGNATPIISVTDTAIAAAGKAGVRLRCVATPSDTAGLHIDNFVAEDTSTGGGGGDVTGSAAWTEDSDTASMSGAATVSGGAGWAEADDTASATGQVKVDGAASWTEDSDSTAIAGSVGGGVSGAANWTESDDTAAIAGTSTVTGAAGWTEDSDAAAITGNVAVPVDGEAEWTEEDDTAAIVGESEAAGQPMIGSSMAGISPEKLREFLRSLEPKHPPKKRKRKQQPEVEKAQSFVPEPLPEPLPDLSTNVSTGAALPDMLQAPAGQQASIAAMPGMNARAVNAKVYKAYLADDLVRLAQQEALRAQLDPEDEEAATMLLLM